MSNDLQELSYIIEAKFSDAVVQSRIKHGELSLVIVLNNLIEVMRFLRDGALCRFSTLVDITAVDYPHRTPRFELVYHLLSMHNNQRIRVKVPLNEGELAPSLTALYPAADWFEREIFDMYGLLFANHPDLRRILTDYGFSGYPLRKDFPTTGYTELRYDELAKRVVYEPVKLAQEYRQFDFLSPWEGMRDALSEGASDDGAQGEASEAGKAGSK